MSLYSNKSSSTAAKFHQLTEIDPKYLSQNPWKETLIPLASGTSSIRIQHSHRRSNHHFHYNENDENSLREDDDDGDEDSGDFILKVTHLPSSSDSELTIQVEIQKNDKSQTFILQKSLQDLQSFDIRLHTCVFNRSWSRLPTINLNSTTDSVSTYIKTLNTLPLHQTTCSHCLHFFDIDNRGVRLSSNKEESTPDINTPAIASACAVRKYAAKSKQELNFELGEILSITDMNENRWWRGKRLNAGYEIGLFPRECVVLIQDGFVSGGHMPPLVGGGNNKKGKVLFKNFLQNRPSRRVLKMRGILKERVFNADLAEHLENVGSCDVPLIVKHCTEFIEKRGIVDGIYRLSGVASNVLKLRTTFDNNHDHHQNTKSNPLLNPTNPTLATITQKDPHAVSSLLKSYCRELPQPLATYNLYDKFVLAINQQSKSTSETSRLSSLRDVCLQLPPPNRRTLSFLCQHLHRVAQNSQITGMTVQNLSIVWAPNLIRSRELESCRSSEVDTAMKALKGIGIQATITEYLIKHAGAIFSDEFCGEFPMETTERSNQEGFIDVGGQPPLIHTSINLRKNSATTTKKPWILMKFFNKPTQTTTRQKITASQIQVITNQFPCAGPLGVQTDWSERGLIDCGSINAINNSPSISINSKKQHNRSSSHDSYFKEEQKQKQQVVMVIKEESLPSSPTSLEVAVENKSQLVQTSLLQLQDVATSSCNLLEETPKVQQEDVGTETEGVLLVDSCCGDEEEEEEEDQEGVFLYEPLIDDEDIKVDIVNNQVYGEEAFYQNVVQVNIEESQNNNNTLGCYENVGDNQQQQQQQLPVKEETNSCYYENVSNFYEDIDEEDKAQEEEEEKIYEAVAFSSNINNNGAQINLAMTTTTATEDAEESSSSSSNATSSNLLHYLDCNFNNNNTYYEPVTVEQEEQGQKVRVDSADSLEFIDDISSSATVTNSPDTEKSSSKLLGRCNSVPIEMNDVTLKPLVRSVSGEKNKVRELRWRFEEDSMKKKNKVQKGDIMQRSETFPSIVFSNVKVAERKVIEEESNDPPQTTNPLLKTSLDLSNPVTRSRIDRYKQERRLYFQSLMKESSVVDVVVVPPMIRKRPSACGSSSSSSEVIKVKEMKNFFESFK